MSFIYRGVVIAKKSLNGNLIILIVAGLLAVIFWALYIFVKSPLMLGVVLLVLIGLIVALVYLNFRARKPAKKGDVSGSLQFKVSSLEVLVLIVVLMLFVIAIYAMIKGADPIVLLKTFAELVGGFMKSG